MFFFGGDVLAPKDADFKEFHLFFQTKKSCSKCRHLPGVFIGHVPSTQRNLSFVNRGNDPRKKVGASLGVF